MSKALATLSASPGRRILAALVFSVLGFGLIGLAAIRPPSELIWLAFMIVAGGIALWGGYRLWKATELDIELREEGLFLSDGTELVRLDNINRVERGAFAFKPSNGFLVGLKKPQNRLWLPGIAWRAGRRLGIGGVTAAGQGKMMADALAAMVAERDALAQETES